MQELKKTWQSEAETIDFEKVLTVLEGLSRGFVPGGKKRKYMLDYDSEKRSVHFTFFKVNVEAEDERQLEKMEMIKFRSWIKSYDDLKGTGLEVTIRRNIRRQGSGNSTGKKSGQVVVCNRCGRAINALKPRKKRKGDIEYIYFQCRRCKEYYVISAADEALRRDIKRFEEMRQNASGREMTDKEHNEAQELLRLNVKRSRELKELHPFESE